MKVLKRDGRVVDFDKEKIKIAILKAFASEDGEQSQYAKDKARDIAHYISSIDKDIMSVEEIQDLVEQKLMSSNRKDVAKHYIIYRNERNKYRELHSDLIKNVAIKLKASDVQNQNANVDEHSFGGRMGEANETVTKEYALNNLVSKIAKDNHLNNEIYIHDLGSYAVGMHNCLSIPFDDLLKNGFNTRQTDVRPANSVNTAFQLLAVIFQLQSLQQFGGVSATHLDWTMIPYVRKSFYKHYKVAEKYVDTSGSLSKYAYAIENELNLELPENISIENDYYKITPSAYQYAMDMTEKEVCQAVEAMYHNLNY